MQDSHTTLSLLGHMKPEHDLPLLLPREVSKNTLESNAVIVSIREVI
jgi:hypothetical protein